MKSADSSESSPNYHIWRDRNLCLVFCASLLVLITSYMLMAILGQYLMYDFFGYVSWAQKNRSALVRVPVYKPGKEKATRVELRNPDPACNPYLAFSVMLAAGLEGIRKKYPLPKEVANNIYEMTDDERKKAGIESLPDDLFEAVKLTEKSSLVKKALGDKVFEFFIRNKKDEWAEYRKQITKFELDKYLPIL